MSKLVRCNKWKKCGFKCGHHKLHEHGYSCGSGTGSCNAIEPKCLPIPTKKKVCEWTPEEFIIDQWNVSCGKKLKIFMDKNDNFKYCPYCGLKIKLLKEESK